MEENKIMSHAANEKTQIIVNDDCIKKMKEIERKKKERKKERERKKQKERKKKERKKEGKTKGKKERKKERMSMQILKMHPGHNISPFLLF